jgi:uncharacterized protein YxjI
MRYVMKQRLLSFGDDFAIQDEAGRDCYFVDGRAFSLGEKASFQDMQGNELLRIQQVLLSFKKSYKILRGDREVARVQKKLFTLFRDAFEIEDDAAGELDATGDFFDREYQFTRDGRTVATVSKRFFAWTDTYGVDIAEGEDDPLILACAVVIDMCCHDED